MRGGRYLAVLAGAGLVAAGCGTRMAPVDGLAAAVTHTEGQTARVAVTTTTQMQGMSVSFTETGTFDFAHSRGEFSMPGPAGMTVIFIAPKVYIKVAGGAAGPLPHGKSWIAFDTGSSGMPGGALLGPAGGSNDPADLLSSLTAISSSVTKLGPATIRGVAVNGFRVDIDPAKAAARVPRWERPGFLAYTKILGSGAIPVDVWVDGQNLVRRVKLSLHLPDGAGAPAGARVVQDTDFYDFGVPVRVSAPPASQIASMPGPTEGSSASASVGAPPAPPPVSGTLPPAQAAAAEQVVAAFWSALGRNDPAAVAQTVPAAQRSCVRSLLDGAPKIAVTAFRILSAQPAGNGRATVRFRVRARARLAGRSFPVFPQAPGGVPWLVTSRTAGHWYVDLSSRSGFVFGGACP